MSNHNAKRQQETPYPSTQSTQPHATFHPPSTRLHHDFNRLTLNTNANQDSNPVHSNQRSQRKQSTVWPASPPLTQAQPPAPVPPPRSRTPFIAASPLQMTPTPIPGTYPVSPTTTTPATTTTAPVAAAATATMTRQPLPPPHSIYQPLVTRTPTPPPGYAEYDKQQRVRMWQQEQLLQEHWAATRTAAAGVGVGVGVRVGVGVGGPGGQYRVGRERMQIPSGMQRESLETRSRGSAAWVYGAGSRSGSGTVNSGAAAGAAITAPPPAPAPAPAPAHCSNPRKEEETVREPLSGETGDLKGEKGREMQKSRIMAGRDEENEKHGGQRGEIDETVRREWREDDDGEEAENATEKDEEWEILRGPLSGVMVDDLVDSDDSDTWC